MSPPSVDAAVHLWSDDKVAYPWSPHDGHETPEMPGSVERLLDELDTYETDLAVCVQPRVYGYDHGCLLDAITRHPDRVLGVALVNPVRPAGPNELLQLLDAGVRGIRLLPLASADPTWLTDDRGDPLWRVVTNLDVPVSILCKPEQLPAVRHRIERVESPVVIDHLGLVTEPGEWLDELLSLADYEHVSVKVSALLDLAARSSADDVATVARDVVDTFGYRRTMFGTDWPYSLDLGTRHDALTILTSAGVRTDDPDLRGGTAMAIWGQGR
jgi:predicted TIM-barrel fold metal-dependent hydrolase